MKKIKFDYKIIGDITEYTAKEFISFLEESKPGIVKVLLDTSGGSGESATAIRDYIWTYGYKVHFYCLGRVESSGLIILNAGDKKFSFPHCTFMTHAPKAGNGKWYAQREHAKKLKIFSVIMQTITPKIKITKDPYYLDAHEAIAHGLIDTIL